MEIRTETGTATVKADFMLAITFVLLWLALLRFILFGVC